MVGRCWEGLTTAICASGPSLSPAVVDAAVAGAGGLILVNDAWRLRPLVLGEKHARSALYACDGAWWDETMKQNAPADMGEVCSGFWTQDPLAAKHYGLNWIQSADRPGISLSPDLIHQGGNSGFQALNLAAHFGAKRIELYGFDMRKVDGKQHFFGDHPAPLVRDLDFARCIRAFEEAAPQLKALGVEVINRTPGSAIRCFPFE